MADDELLRQFEQTHPHLKNFVEFLGDFNKETERGASCPQLLISITCWNGPWWRS